MGVLQGCCMVNVQDPRTVRSMHGQFSENQRSVGFVGHPLSAGGAWLPASFEVCGGIFTVTTEFKCCIEIATEACPVAVRKGFWCQVVHRSRLLRAAEGSTACQHSVIIEQVLT